MDENKMKEKERGREKHAGEGGRENARVNKPALQETGGSFCRSFNSLVMRFEAIASRPNLRSKCQVSHFPNCTKKVM